MLDRTLCRRDLEASATVETLSSTTRRGHRTRAEPEQSVDLRHPKAAPRIPGTPVMTAPFARREISTSPTFHDGD
jgi:hypothetical protein